MSTEATGACIFTGGRVLPMTAGAPARGSDVAQPMAIAARDGRIQALGEAAALCRAFPDARPVDLGGRLVTPGLIDCHTHIVYGGQRADEAERRARGESYEDIARAGGGILRTVASTAALSDAQLIGETLPRVDALLADGVTTLEVKSGYGLTLAAELRLLRVARRLGAERALSVVTTWLGAHRVPADFSAGADAYIEQLCRHDLPSIATSGLADAVDGYCESIAFSVPQIERLFERASELGLPVKLHADQLSNLHGAALAARHAALSADHLEYTDAAGVAALARAGTVAVLLPGACYFLRQHHAPPIPALRAARVPMAIATDCNPGTSPLSSLLIAMSLAAVQFGLSSAECLAGVTREAARALGRLHECGTLEAGKWCDLAVWNVDTPAELVHSLGVRPLHRRIWHGRAG